MWGCQASLDTSIPQTIKTLGENRGFFLFCIKLYGWGVRYKNFGEFSDF